MKADNSRNTFRAAQHYRDVVKQQGRVDVDADWNEQQAINVYRTETEAIDVIGRTGAPLHAAGFAITAEGATLRVGAGRYYVDGILCENDRDKLDYREQPHRRDVASLLEELRIGKATLGIIYLDVWLRHITALHDPLIREIALGGPDTATRTQVVWQVRVLPLPLTPPNRERIAALQARRAELQARLAAVLTAGGDGAALVQELSDVNRELAELQATAASGPITCDSVLPAWDKRTALPTGTLNVRTSPTPPTTDLCELPPRAGYQRTENQLYRVEIHHGGTLEEATFKWSRDNGSLATAVEEASGLDVTVGSIGPDEVLGFAANQWVELVDDGTELAGEPGQLMQIEHVPEGSRSLRMKLTPPAIDRSRHPILRRWDQSGPDGNANGIAITGEWQPIEDGVEVRFSAGVFHSGDYWLIPARVATGDIEWPRAESPLREPLPQPRRGIEHHFSRLALVELDREALTVTGDCRKLFPPLTELTAAPPTTPTPSPAVKAMHVKGTSWRNDAPLGLDVFLEKGLVIGFDRLPQRESISSKTMIVTLEVPILPESGFEPAASARELAPKLGVILPGEITPLNETQFRWLPIRTGLKALDPFVVRLPQVLARVTLKGAKIWSNEDGRLVYLDGCAVGEPARDPNSEALRTELVFPSGSNQRSSDFESWFLLMLPATLGGFSIAPVNVRLAQRGNALVFVSLEGAGDVAEVVGTITLSAPAAATVEVALKVPENRDLIEIPETVKVAAGRVSTRFLIAPGRRPPDGTARIPIIASTGAAEFTATLTIGRG